MNNVLMETTFFFKSIVIKMLNYKITEFLSASVRPADCKALSKFRNKTGDYPDPFVTGKNLRYTR